MAETEWFDKEPGQTVYGKELEDGSHMMLIGVDHPDWVRLPTNLGGQQVRVLRSGPRVCVAKDCKEIHTCLYLEGGIFCIECTSTKQFFWCKETDKE